MKWLLSLIALFGGLYGSPLKEFDVFQRTLSKEYVTDKIKRFLQYSNGIEDFFEIKDDALVLFSSPGDKKEGKAEYTLFFSDQRESFNPYSKKPLNSAKIAIDPGHFGGKFAKLEERYIEIEHEGRLVSFDEGTLTFLTATYLKKLLEEKGAHVFLTRENIGEGAYPESFFDYLKSRPELWQKGVSLSEIFRRDYNRLDLRERARLINEYRADLTIAIHYNAIESNEKVKVTDLNYNLAFIPGAFCANEMTELEDRFHFLRLICTQDLEESVRFANLAIEGFTSRLKAPPFSAPMQNSKCISSGVYSRNLCLTRLIRGPICYGETLIQNNREELKHLSECNEQVDGVCYPKRVREVAEAYLEAIISYFRV
jgi:hypothetical protein